MSNHNWVELTITPVTSEVTDDDKVMFFASEEALEIAESDRHYVCWSCKAAPSLEQYYEPCPGAPTIDQLIELPTNE